MAKPIGLVTRVPMDWVTPRKQPFKHIRSRADTRGRSLAQPVLLCTGFDIFGIISDEFSLLSACICYDSHKDAHQLLLLIIPHPIPVLVN
jgi:hypothetical protein